MARPKIVYWDIETLPDPKEIYKRLPSIGQWPGRTLKAELGAIISFGYQIEGQKTIHCINAWDFPNWEFNRWDDSLISAAMLEVLHDCDESVTHNGKWFDERWLRTRLAKHRLPPLPKTHHVDTKNVIKGNFSLYSNSLANAAKFFGIEEKMQIKNKWDLWTRIAFHEETKADLQLMSDYCKQDITTLRQLHQVTRPYHGTHSVNKSLWVDPDKMVCPICGSPELRSNGYRTAGSIRYKRMQCLECGTWAKLNKAETKISAL